MQPLRQSTELAEQIDEFQKWAEQINEFLQTERQERERLQNELQQLQRKDKELEARIEETGDYAMQKLATIIQHQLALIAQALNDVHNPNENAITDLKSILEGWDTAIHTMSLEVMVDKAREMLRTDLGSRIEIQSDVRRLKKLLEAIGVDVEMMLKNNLAA